MSEYILTIIGAALLAAMTNLISPDKWQPYIRTATGLVVMSVILSPIASMRGIEFKMEFKAPETAIEDGENIQMEAIKEGLEQRVIEDAKMRLENEFGITAEVDVEIKTNADMQIERVEEIVVSGTELTAAAKNRLAEVYGLNPDEVITDDR